MSSKLARAGALGSNLNCLCMTVSLLKVSGFPQALRFPLPIKAAGHEIGKNGAWKWQLNTIFNCNIFFFCYLYVVYYSSIVWIRDPVINTENKEVPMPQSTGTFNDLLKRVRISPVSESY